MATLNINGSGLQVPIYDDVYSSNQLGTLYPNELYIVHLWIDSQVQLNQNIYGSLRINFRNVQGQVQEGYINMRGTSTVWTWMKAAQYAGNYRYRMVMIGGVERIAMKLRRAEELYWVTADDRFGLDTTLPTGTEIILRSLYAPVVYRSEGTVDYQLLEITHYSSYGAFITFDGAVDVGLNQGATPSTISLDANFTRGGVF